MVDTPSDTAATKPSSTTPSSGLQKPGDVIIDQIYLNSVAGTSIDLKPFFIELHVFEDIFSPTLHGSIIIRDSINLVGTVPIVGDEILTFSVRTPFQETPAEDDFFNKIHKSFSIYAIKDRKLNNDREQYYQLFFCSVEASVDNAVRLSQKFNGTTDEIADTIFTEHLSIPRILTRKDSLAEDPDGKNKTPLFISDVPHRSLITFVAPMWSPIRCLNWLAARSIGAKRESPTVLFYETTKAFYFTSIEDLIVSQIEQDAVFCDYIYHPNLQDLQTGSALSRGYSTVEAMKFMTNLDIIQGQDLGHFASTVHSFDMVKKEYTPYVYDHGFNFNKTTHLGDYKLSLDKANLGKLSVDTEKKYNMIFPINVLRSADNKSFMATVNPGVLDSTEDSIDLHPETFIPQRNSSLMDLTTMRLQLTVPGRTDIEVGKLIRFYYPSVADKSEKDSESFVWDILISGLYMITSIHHQITTLQHKMHIEIAKDSYSIPLYDVEEDTGQ